MAGEFRYIPQDTLNDIANLVNPVLDVIVPFVPYIAVMAFIPGLLRAVLQYKIEASKGSFIDAETDRKLRSVPFAFGFWGLLTMHLVLVGLPGMAQSFAASEGARATLEVTTMAFAFFVLFGLLNVLLRFVLDSDVRRKLGKLGYLDMLIIATVLLPALGVGLYAWSTVRWASVWTGTVLWQSWIDAFTFNFNNTAALKEMPVFVKLHMLVAPLAAAHVLYSRLLAHLILPRFSLWRMDAVRDQHGSVGAVEAAALMYGISAEKKEAKH
ncbi:MAG: respiratory nitrate reductase subunit gamma [Planctomycetes bacterium]|nr:respiratory nitrate reductase subunit gamma [Planctomycetota bacterium]